MHRSLTPRSPVNQAVAPRSMHITGKRSADATMKLYAEVVSYFGSSNSIKARVALRVGSGSAGHSRRYGVGRNGRVCALPFSGIATFPEQSGRSFSHKSRGLTI